MRILWLIGLLALASGCSSYSVRCNKHLRPINTADGKAAAGMRRPVLPAPAAPAVGTPASIANDTRSGPP
jgi:hypothetical protein